MTCGSCRNGTTCDTINGTCLHGCAEGYSGIYCKQGGCTQYTNDDQSEFICIRTCSVYICMCMCV